jgi:Domain of unknown function (DUF4091)
VAHGARQPAKAGAEMRRSLHWTEIAKPWANPQGNQNPDYPGAPAGLKGVAPSMRLKYLRDGLQDYAIPPDTQELVSWRLGT